MNEELKKMLAIKDEDGKYFFDAKDVAEFHGVSDNAVYSSREYSKSQKKKKAKAEKEGVVFSTDKLDKLMAFEKIKEMLERDEKSKVSISGDKDGILNGLGNILSADKKYEVNYREV